MASSESNANCGVCNIKCNTSTMLCNKCKKWHNTRCIDMTIQRLNLIKNELK